MELRSAISLRPSDGLLLSCNTPDRGYTLDGNTVLSISTMPAPFGVGGRPRKRRPTVENTARIFVGDIARALLTGLARVEVTVVINSKPEVLDVVHEPCNYGGNGRWFFYAGRAQKRSCIFTWCATAIGRTAIGSRVGGAPDPPGRWIMRANSHAGAG